MLWSLNQKERRLCKECKAFDFFSDETESGDKNNNKPKHTVWKNMQETDFNRKQFQK